MSRERPAEGVVDAVRAAIAAEHRAWWIDKGAKPVPTMPPGSTVSPEPRCDIG
jgi:hypothetical protein